MQLQSHLGLSAVSPHAPAQASAISPPTVSAPPPSAPTASLDVLAAAAASATSPTAPQPDQAEDDPSLATDRGGTTSPTNFLVLLSGQLVLEVMFILLILVLLVPHA